MGLFAGTKWDVPPHCERCGCLERDCRCPAEKTPAKPPSEQTLRVWIEKRKAGRVVTLIAGLEPSESPRGELLSQLKTVCGAGGGYDDVSLLIQGDHLARVVKYLQDTGYRIAPR